MFDDEYESGGRYWTREEYDELSDLGEKAVGNNDVSALQQLRDRFADKDATEKAYQLNTAMDMAIDGWTEDIKGVTGVDVVYVEKLYGNIGGWREVSTGQFVGKLDYTVFGSTDEDYMQYMIDKMSTWL